MQISIQSSARIMAIVNLMSGATIHKLDGRHERVRKGKEAAVKPTTRLSQWLPRDA
jgi:hypothetical protein